MLFSNLLSFVGRRVGIVLIEYGNPFMKKAEKENLGKKTLRGKWAIWELYKLVGKKIIIRVD